jgi:hypothetical protein
MYQAVGRWLMLLQYFCAKLKQIRTPNSTPSQPRPAQPRPPPANPFPSHYLSLFTPPISYHYNHRLINIFHYHGDLVNFLPARGHWVLIPYQKYVYNQSEPWCTRPYASNVVDTHSILENSLEKPQEQSMHPSCF